MGFSVSGREGHLNFLPNRDANTFSLTLPLVKSAFKNFESLGVFSDLNPMKARNISSFGGIDGEVFEKNISAKDFHQANEVLEKRNKEVTGKTQAPNSDSKSIVHSIVKRQGLIDCEISILHSGGRLDNPEQLDRCLSIVLEEDGVDDLREFIAENSPTEKSRQERLCLIDKSLRVCRDNRRHGLDHKEGAKVFEAYVAAGLFRPEVSIEQFNSVVSTVFVMLDFMKHQQQQAKRQAEAEEKKRQEAKEESDYLRKQKLATERNEKSLEDKKRVDKDFVAIRRSDSRRPRDEIAAEERRETQEKAVKEERTQRKDEKAANKKAFIKKRVLEKQYRARELEQIIQKRKASE